MKPPVTTAVRALRAAGVDFTHHLYEYEEHGGTAVSARELGVAEHAVVKTLVMQDDKGKPLLVLMHGDRKVSTRELARQIGARSVTPAPAELAQKATGYQFGGTSPFGTRLVLPVYVEETVLGLERIYINGGKRGYLVGLSPSVLPRLVGATPVRVGLEE